jgi:DJ-1/PfpI family.
VPSLHACRSTLEDPRHRATGSVAIKDDLENAGATWVDAPAFRDGALVWGRVVADIPDFNRELVGAIAGER